MKAFNKLLLFALLPTVGMIACSSAKKNTETSDPYQTQSSEVPPPVNMDAPPPDEQPAIEEPVKKLPKKKKFKKKRKK